MVVLSHEGSLFIIEYEHYFIYGTKDDGILGCFSEYEQFMA